MGLRVERILVIKSLVKVMINKAYLRETEVNTEWVSQYLSSWFQPYLKLVIN